MIHWLVQSTADHPTLAEGRPPAGLLAPQETVRFAGMQVPKRRHDWLLGRWTAKRLLQSVFESEAGVNVPLSQFIIENDPDGAPVVSLAAPLPQPLHAQPATAPADDGLVADPESVRLSISHAGDHAFCAVSTDARVDVGADIERIERRPWELVEDFFSPEEIEWLLRTPADLHDTLVTAIWSAKEAALKALRRGLTIDTRRLSCLIGTPDSAESAPFGYLWTRFEVACDPMLLRELGRAPAAECAAAGWWRVLGGYVLTLVVW